MLTVLYQVLLMYLFYLYSVVFPLCFINVKINTKQEIVMYFFFTVYNCGDCSDYPQIRNM